jgi:hypothetical protein
VNNITDSQAVSNPTADVTTQERQGIDKGVIHKGVKPISSQNKRFSPNLAKGVRIPKGVSGNPGGRPKTKLLREHVLEMFNENPHRCVKRLYNERIDLFMAYAFGKPTDTLEVSGPNGSQLVPSEMILAAALLAKGL